MQVYILQKSITDVKSQMTRKPFVTQATTLGQFICEMVEKNATAKDVPANRIELFDALVASGNDRISYGTEKKTFSAEEMKEFALQAFADKVYLVKNVTKDILYEGVAQDMQLSEGDEIALIKLKYIRGAIW